MRADGSKFGVKTRPQNRQKLKNILGKLGFSFSLTPIFLTQNSIFFNGSPISEKSEKIFLNGFPISSTAFRFLQRLSAFFNGFSIFFNGFPLSKKSGKIYLWWQVYKRLLSKLCISAKVAIFRDKNNRRQEYERSLSELCIFHSELCNSC
jgi:hypothetical protein